MAHVFGTKLPSQQRQSGAAMRYMTIASASVDREIRRLAPQYFHTHSTYSTLDPLSACRLKTFGTLGSNVQFAFQCHAR